MRRLAAGAIAAALAVAAAGAPSALAQACLKADGDTAVRVSGTLATSRHTHPNGTVFTAYSLRLAPPACVDVTVEGKVEREPRVERIQLAGDLDEAKLRRLVGRRVSAHGPLFEGHTAWHVTRVLLLLGTIDAAR
jgi:hypothetical protein